MQHLTRRQLVMATLALTGAGLAACVRRTDAPNATPVAAPTQAAPATVAAPAAAQPTAVPAAPTQPAAAAMKRGGSVTIGVQNDWLSMDPAYNNADFTPHRMLFDPLLFFRADEQGKWGYQPGLAERWEFDDKKGMLWLRQGVKFHDGSDWDTEVLKFNLERIIGDPQSPARGSLAGLDFNNPITVVDKYTAQLNLEGPSPGLLQQFSDRGDFDLLWVTSKAGFEKLGKDEFGRQAVGSGPMQFVEWRPSDRVVLKRFDNYWQQGTDGQPLPYFDQITYRLIVNDSVRTTEIKAHTTDVMATVPTNEIAAVQADPQLQFVDADWLGTTWRLYFNARGGPFADNLALRQATLYAIDRETLANILAPGVSNGAYYIFQPGAPGYDPTVPKYDFNLDKARALMQQAGLADGIDVSLLTINRELDQRQGEILKQMWSQVGIRASIEAMERAALNARVLTGNADFHFTIGLAGVTPGDPDTAVRPYLHSQGNFNKTHSNVPDLDRAIDKAASTYDLNQRVAAYRDVQQLAFDSAYLGYLWTQRNNYVYNKRLQGYPKSPTEYLDLRTVWLSV